MKNFHLFKNVAECLLCAKHCAGGTDITVNTTDIDSHCTWTFLVRKIYTNKGLQLNSEKANATPVP